MRSEDFCGLVGLDFGWPSGVAALGSCAGEAGRGSFTDDGAFKFGEDAGDVEHGHSSGCRGVDGFGEALELGTFVFDPVEDDDEVGEGSGEAVEAVDDDGVSWPQEIEHGVELRSVPSSTGGVFGEDLEAALALEGFDLEGDVLVIGGDAGVADFGWGGFVVHCEIFLR